MDWCLSLSLGGSQLSKSKAWPNIFRRLYLLAPTGLKLDQTDELSQKMQGRAEACCAYDHLYYQEMQIKMSPSLPKRRLPCLK